MRVVLTLCLLALTACGADGAPEPVEEAIEVDPTTSVGVTAEF